MEILKKHLSDLEEMGVIVEYPAGLWVDEDHSFTFTENGLYTTHSQVDSVSNYQYEDLKNDKIAAINSYINIYYINHLVVFLSDELI